jgi:hypothetical protein
MENVELIILGIKIGDWIQIGVLILAVLGLYYNIKEQKKNNFRERVKIISDTLNQIYEDKELSEILYKFISSNPLKPFIYSKDFHDSKTEIALDKLLFKLDFLAKQYYGNLLELKDFSVIETIYIDIYRNEEIKKYFEYLDNYFTSINKPNNFCLYFRKMSELLISKQNF